MKILQINGVYPIKSTGRIVRQIEDIQKENGIESYIACGEGIAAENVYIVSSMPYIKFNILKTRLFGKHGFYNNFATRKLLKHIDKIEPDIIHLHNIHGHYINIKLLFEYIKKHNIPVVWTLHDCWSFTGHCSHFDYVGCDKWKTGCHHCKMQKSYPVSWFFDRSKGNYKAKKELFTSIEKMHIVTPSHWLKGLCERSFLGKYPITAIHNGIDTDVFVPVESDIRQKLNIQDKFVILGVINSFSGYKGGKHFLELSQMLSEDEVIVLVSFEGDTSDLPSNIIPVPRTADDKQLAQYYSMADVFVNPTLQDTFSMVNIEALACGTPVVTFNSGGAAEMLDEKSGFSVCRSDADGLYSAIKKIKDNKIQGSDCRNRALDFKAKDWFEKYLDIYKEVSDKEF